jgi:hypothetical protein
VLSVKEVEGVSLEDIGNLGKPVFVYDYLTLAVYGSINFALSALSISPTSLLTSISSGLVYTRPDGLVISDKALTELEVAAYIVKDKPTQMEYSVTLTDAEGTVVEEYSSLRAFCRAKGLAMRTFTSKLPGLTEYEGLKLTLTAKSRRLGIYCYDPDSGQRIGHYLV